MPKPSLEALGQEGIQRCKAIFEGRYYPYHDQLELEQQVSKEIIANTVSFKEIDKKAMTFFAHHGKKPPVNDCMLIANILLAFFADKKKDDPKYADLQGAIVTINDNQERFGASSNGGTHTIVALSFNEEGRNKEFFENRENFEEIIFVDFFGKKTFSGGQFHRSMEVLVDGKSSSRVGENYSIRVRGTLSELQPKSEHRSKL